MCLTVKVRVNENWPIAESFCDREFVKLFSLHQERLWPAFEDPFYEMLIQGISYQSLNYNRYGYFYILPKEELNRFMKHSGWCFAYKKADNTKLVALPVSLSHEKLLLNYGTRADNAFKHYNEVHMGSTSNGNIAVMSKHLYIDPRYVANPLKYNLLKE